MEPAVVIASDVLERIEKHAESRVPSHLMHALKSNLARLGILPDMAPEAFRILNVIEKPIQLADITINNADDYSREVQASDIVIFQNPLLIGELKKKIIEATAEINAPLAEYLRKKGISSAYLEANDQRSPVHRRQSVISHVASVGNTGPLQERNNVNILIHGQGLDTLRMDRSLAAVEAVAILDSVIEPCRKEIAAQLDYGLQHQRDVLATLEKLRNTPER